MNDCMLQQHVSAYFDGELNPDMRQVVERHLASCEVCAAQLRTICRLSDGIAGAELDELDDIGLAGIHDAIDHAVADGESAFRILPTLGFLGALAASVLIVAGVWLLQLPAAQPHRAVAGGPPRALASEWERVATNLRVDPRPQLFDDSPLSPRYAAAIDWMLSSLSPTERKPWAKPSSL